MAKRLFEIFSILVSWTLFYSCIDDKTSGFKTDGSPITITIQDSVFDVELGNPVNISPDVNQVETDLPLTYEWRAMAIDGGQGSDSLRFIGTEKELNYKFDRSGVFKVRLRVENKYGSKFQFFVVNVLSPFEVGILVLSNDKEDNGRLSFLRAKNENEILDKTESDFNLDAFFLNTNIKLRGVRDAVLIGMDISGIISQLVISSETNGMLYFVEPTSFLVEYMEDVSASLPGLKPTTLGSIGESFLMGNSLFFGTKDEQGNSNDLYVINTVEHFIYPDMNNFPGEASYDKVLCKFKSQPTSYRWTEICCVDNTHKLIHVMDEYQAPYDLSEILDGRILVNVGFYAESSDLYKLIFITRDESSPNSISIFRTKGGYWGSEIFDGEPYTYNDDKITLTSNSDLVASDKYQSLFYCNGNGIYRWSPYVTSEPKLPTDPIITLPDTKDVVTCMAVSPNGQYLYVCVYNEDAKTDLKGRLLVVNIDNMEIIKTFEGISDRAVKIMWKDARLTDR